METYTEYRQFFPQLPFELWQRVLWFVLRFTVKEKLKICFPLKNNFDVYENFHNFDNENWDGHCHTSVVTNVVVDKRVLGYSHKFYTDCCMWYEGYEREEIVSMRDHEMFYHERSHMIFYKTQTFILMKQRVDNPDLYYKVIYVVQIYLDGSAQLVEVNHE